MTLVCPECEARQEHSSPGKVVRCLSCGIRFAVVESPETHSPYLPEVAARARTHAEAILEEW